MKLNKSWLYGLIVFLAQTCNPHYNANNNFNERSYSQDDVIEIPADAFESEDLIVEPPRNTTPLSEAPKVEERSKVVPSQEEIFVVVEDMPRFPGCEGEGMTKNELAFCAEKKMLKFIYGNLKYPEKAKKNGITGRVIMSFYVDEDGKLEDIKVLRDIGSGCGEEAIRVLKMMNETPQPWTPGKSRGKPVKVRFTLPIKFEMDDKIVEKIPPPPPVEEKLFNVSEEMPRFPGCEGQGLEKKELNKCANDKMLNFIYEKIKYPEEAKKKRIEGRVVARFVVGKDGSISNINVLRDPGGNFTEETIRVIKLMNDMPEKWIAGKHREKKVKVKMTVPISFKL